MSLRSYRQARSEKDDIPAAAIGHAAPLLGRDYLLASRRCVRPPSWFVSSRYSPSFQLRIFNLVDPQRIVERRATRKFHFTFLRSRSARGPTSARRSANDVFTVSFGRRHCLLPKGKVLFGRLKPGPSVKQATYLSAQLRDSAPYLRDIGWRETATLVTLAADEIEELGARVFDLENASPPGAMRHTAVVDKRTA